MIEVERLLAKELEVCIFVCWNFRSKAQLCVPRAAEDGGCI